VKTVDVAVEELAVALSDGADAVLGAHGSQHLALGYLVLLPLFG
jgi:hypothetical protein